MKYRKTCFKKSALATAFGLLIFGCTDPEYTPDNFSHFERLADRNPEDAIDELRYFVHNNPEHSPSLLLLSRLLAKQAKDDSDLYLARHYIQRAIRHADDKALRHEAEGEYLQIRIRQDSTPGDATALVELSEFAKEHERYREATEFLLQASFEHVGAQEYGDAFSTLEESQELIDNHAPKKEGKNEKWDRLIDQSDHLMVTLGFLEDDFTASLDAAKRIEEREASETYSDLPHPRLVKATINTLNEVAGSGWLPWPGSQDDEDTVSAPELIDDLEKADELNQERDDINRLQLSARLYERLAEEAEEGDAAEAVREYAQERLDHYQSRIDAQDIEGDS